MNLLVDNGILHIEKSDISGIVVTSSSSLRIDLYRSDVPLNVPLSGDSGFENLLSLADTYCIDSPQFKHILSFLDNDCLERLEHWRTVRDLARAAKEQERRKELVSFAKRAGR